MRARATLLLYVRTIHILPVAGRVTRDIILMCGLLRGSTLEGLHALAAGWERLFLFFKLHALPRRSTEVLRVLFLGRSEQRQRATTQVSRHLGRTVELNNTARPHDAQPEQTHLANLTPHQQMRCNL